MAELSNGPLGSQYDFLDSLGRGNTGQVWKAVDKNNDAFAIKVLDSRLMADQNLARLFLSARTLLMNLSHPNLARVHDIVLEGSTLALVTEFVDGPDLGRLLRDKDTVAPQEVAQIGSAVCAGLTAIYAGRVAHGDLKPTNILLASGADPSALKITDTGVSRLANLAFPSGRPTLLPESPHYTSPEMIYGEPPTEQSDLYSLGLILYELSCGVPPFSGSPSDIGQAQISMAPGRPDGMPDDLWNVIEALTRKNPKDRPATADRAAELLRSAGTQLAGVPALAALKSPPAAIPLGPAPVQTALTMQLPTAPVVAAPPAPPPPQAPGSPPSQPWPAASQATADPHGPTAPGSDTSGRWTLLIVLVCVAVLLAITGIVLFVIKPFGSNPRQGASASIPAATAPAGVSSPRPTRTVTVTPSPTPTPSADPRTAAQQQLISARNSSLQGLDLDGRWALMLGSKYEGVTDPRQVTKSGSHTFGLPDIWDEHQDLTKKLQGEGINNVLMLQSADFGQQKATPGVIWVTIADPGGLHNYSEAQAECAQLFPNLAGDDLANSCVPRQLTPPS